MAILKIGIEEIIGLTHNTIGGKLDLSMLKLGIESVSKIYTHPLISDVNGCYQEFRNFYFSSNLQMIFFYDPLDSNVMELEIRFRSKQTDRDEKINQLFGEGENEGAV